MDGAEWVTGRDAAFLFLEGPTTPYHIAGLWLVEGPAPSEDRILDAVARRLPLLPRFRRRLHFVPVLDRPAWVDDDRFDLRYHVRRTTIPAPGTEERLKPLVAELMEMHLNRFRPLWELWVVEGLAGGRFAVVLKVHHAMADGVAGVNDAMLLLDRVRRPRRGQPEPWSPHPEGDGRLLARALADRAERPLRLAESVGRAVAAPGRTARGLARTASGVAAVAQAGLRPVSASPLNRPIGPNRAFDLARSSLQDLKDVKTAFGGTVNDVVLAVVSGGLRRWLLDREERVQGLELRALVPVSLRGPAERGSAGNRVTGVLAPLPVSEADPVRRLRVVARAMAAAKRSPQAVGAGLLLDLPAAVPAVAARSVAAIQRVQRFFTLSLPNLRGPEEPLYLCGRRVIEMVPIPPLSANAALIVGAVSYAGNMAFGLLSDRDAVPDVGLIAEGIEKSIQELVHEAGAAR